jgi:hypothetical protein
VAVLFRTSVHGVSWVAALSPVAVACRLGRGVGCWAGGSAGRAQVRAAALDRSGRTRCRKTASCWRPCCRDAGGCRKGVTTLSKARTCRGKVQGKNLQGRRRGEVWQQRNRGAGGDARRAMASIRGCAGGRAGARGKARAGYVGSRDATQTVSGRFYMGTGARVQGEGGVQKKQTGTGVRLADFYRAKHAASTWHAR